MTVSQNADTGRVMTRAESDAEWGRPHGRKWQPTGRMIWLSHDYYDSPFRDHEKAIPETNYHAELAVGCQTGTYFKTSLIHEGMTVWLWGGVHPIDRANGVVAGGGRVPPIDRSGTV